MNTIKNTIESSEPAVVEEKLGKKNDDDAT